MSLGLTGSLTNSLLKLIKSKTSKESVAEPAKIEPLPIEADTLLVVLMYVPVVALMAPIQDTPRCILVHEASDANSLEELAGLTMQAGGGRPYLTFMQAKGLLDDVKIVPYSGVPKFAESPKNAMQGYNFSEPLLAGGHR